MEDGILDTILLLLVTVLSIAGLVLGNSLTFHTATYGLKSEQHEMASFGKENLLSYNGNERRN